MQNRMHYTLAQDFIVGYWKILEILDVNFAFLSKPKKKILIEY